ncbi:MAG TPA: hypothetical protein VND64_05960 [Pirellulales bacterium]|nr:hypothetical protein [Pirellulales bacterium]
MTVIYRVGASLTDHFCVLSLKGNVEPDFDWDQDEVWFTGGKSDFATVHFRPVHMPNLRLLSAFSSHAAFEVTIASASSLQVHFHADRWKNDRGEFSIVVSTDNDKLPTCRLPVRVASPK